MQEYRRQIAYFYAYEHGQQIKGAGFVKAEVRGDRCTLGVCLKSCCRSEEESGKVYICFCRRDRIIGIYLGELKRQDGALQWQGILDAQDIQKKGIRFRDTKGVWVRQTSGRDYVAEWEDEPVDVSRFMLYPKGGEKCIGCPRLGSCRGSAEYVSVKR